MRGAVGEIGDADVLNSWADLIALWMMLFVSGGVTFVRAEYKYTNSSWDEAKG